MKNFDNQTVWKNSACRTYHLGDDVLAWNGTLNGQHCGEV